MKIKKEILDQFNAGILSVSMEGCDQGHYDEIYTRLLMKDKKELGYENFLYYKFYHKTKDGKGILAWMYQPQNKNCVHYSQIWEEELEVDMDGLFYVFLPGKQAPQVQYTSYNEAQKEAERLCKKEKQPAYVCEVRAIVELSNEVKFTYR